MGLVGCDSQVVAIRRLLAYLIECQRYAHEPHQLTVDIEDEMCRSSMLEAAMLIEEGLHSGSQLMHLSLGSGYWAVLAFGLGFFRRLPLCIYLTYRSASWMQAHETPS